jgi:hypothetical protein
MTSSRGPRDQSSPRCSAASSSQTLPSPSRSLSYFLCRRSQFFSSFASCNRLGAGEGNRTLVVSLEGCCSTIELHPPSGISSDIRGQRSVLLITDIRPLSPGGWWRGLDSNQRRLSQRIYSPSPLTTRAPLRRLHRCSVPAWIASVAGRQTKTPRRRGRDSVAVLWGSRVPESTPLGAENPCNARVGTAGNRSVR